MVCAISLNLQNRNGFIEGLSIRVKGQASTNALKATCLQFLPESIKVVGNIRLFIFQELTACSHKHIRGIITKDDISIGDLSTIKAMLMLLLSIKYSWIILEQP